VAINDGADGSTSVTDGSITPEKTSFIVCEGSGETISTQVPNFTNLANPKSSDWKTDTRFSTSSGTMSAYTGGIVTNAIHCVAGDVVRIKGIMGGSGSTSSAYFQAVGYKDEAGETKCSSSGVLFEKSISQAGNGVKDIVTVENGVTTWTAYTYQPGVDDGAVQSTGFVGAVSLRIGGVPVGSVDDIIVTINEPITYTEVTSGGKTYTLSEDIVVPHAKAVKSGARWFALGDSITEGWTSAVDTSASSGYKQFKNTNEDERWVNIVAQKNGYEMTNYGVGGTGYYWAANNAKVQVDAIDFSKCDFVTLAYGCNDWKYDGSVIGSEEDLPQTVFASSDGNNSIIIDSDTASDAIVYKNGVLLTPSTDYSISNGYLNLTANTVKRDCFEIYKSSESMVANMAYCIKKIIRDNPYCKIFAITPINCRSLGTYATNWGVSYTGTAGCGKSLEYVYQMQKIVCEAYGIELIDMTHNSIVNRENIRTMLADYVHPTVECHAVLGRELARKIKFV
jgi:lysophospholipase L1-like esterase